MKQVNMLITGAGGLGQEILKAARRLPLAKKIVCVDANEKSPGLFRSDKAYMIPNAHDKNFIARLLDICRIEKIQIILIGTQQELLPLSKAVSQFESQNIKIVVSSPQVIRTAADKYLCMKKLQETGIVCPATVLATDRVGINNLIRRFGFPLFTKPRKLSGSKGIAIIKNKGELSQVPTTNIVQPYLGKGHEFTAGCFMRKEQFDFILLERELFRGTGLSGAATPVKSTRVRKYCQQIVKALNLTSPCNVQLKIINQRPAVFEVNPRFSSTTSIQAALGINFVHLAVATALNLPIPRYEIKSKIAWRYFNEIYLDPKQVADLHRNQHLSHPRSYLEDNF